MKFDNKFIKKMMELGAMEDRACSELERNNAIKEAKELYSKHLAEFIRDKKIVNSCYALFDEEENIVQLYQTEETANKGMEEFKRSHKHTEFYVDTIQIN